MRWLVLGFVGVIGCSNEESPPSPEPTPPPPGTTSPCPAVPKLLATGLRPGATDGAALYGFAFQSIQRMPLGGGDLAMSVRGIDTTIDFGLTVSNNWLYWGARGIGVIRAPLYDGPTFVVSDAHDVTRFAVDGNDIYFLAAGVLYRQPADGSLLPQRLYSDPEFQELAVTADSVYVAGRRSNGAGIMAFDRLGLSRGSIASWFALSAGHMVASADGRALFVTDGSEGSVRRVDTRNGDVTMILDMQANNSEFDPFRGGIAYDAGYVYTIVHPYVWRIAEDGSSRSIVANDATAFAIAGDWLYYQHADELYGVCK